MSTPIETNTDELRAILDAVNELPSNDEVLNLKVVAYATEDLLTADTPTENTIGIVTTTPIPAWYFSAEQPENMVEGDVWMKTDAESPVSFNAVKKNNITVYPFEAMQLNEELEKVPAFCYLAGKWVELWKWNGELYKEGKEYEDITGGWVTGVIWSGYSASGSTVTKKNDYLYIDGADGSSHGFKTANQIDLTPYSAFNIRYTAPSTINVSVAATFPKDSENMIAKSNMSGGTNVTKSLSLNSVNQAARIGIFDYNGKGVEIYEMWLS